MACKQMSSSASVACNGRTALRFIHAARPQLTVSRRGLLLARSATADATAASLSEAVEVASATKAVKVVAGVTDFEAMLQDAARVNDLVVVDFYTQWCGPCKLIAPQIEAMAVEYEGKGVRFAKVDCGKDNDSKRWAMALGIKVLPTFRFYKNGSSEHVDQVTGSKVEHVRNAVEKHKEGAAVEVAAQ